MAKKQPKNVEPAEEPAEEQENDQGAASKYHKPPLPPLTDKEDIQGKNITLEGAVEREGDNGPYLIFHGTVKGKEVHFTSGKVLMRQWTEEKMEEQLPLIVQLKLNPNKTKGRQDFWTFEEPL